MKAKWDKDKQVDEYKNKFGKWKVEVDDKWEVKKNIKTGAVGKEKV